jgi:hypothetical protein
MVRGAQRDNARTGLLRCVEAQAKHDGLTSTLNDAGC